MERIIIGIGAHFPFAPFQAGKRPDKSKKRWARIRIKCLVSILNYRAYLLRWRPMGTFGRKIVDTDVDELTKLLNKAFSDEWLAYYQYWIGSKIVRGPNKEAVIAELTLHATEELGHAVLLTTRIIQLGGTPVTNPKDWYIHTNCGYEAPDDPYVIKVLEQNIKGEQCAIKTYNSLLKKTRDKDPVTYNILLGILQMEVEHEEDLQALLEDISVMMKER
jgi:bacterioferritin